MEEEIQALQAENNRLRQEITRLRDKVSEMESTMLERLSEFATEAVGQATAPLVEELNKAYTEIVRLKAIN